MRDTGLLSLRLTLGGYLAVHGAQKLFGHFDGPGLDKAGAGFEHMGLRPGKAFATLAATSELGGGLLTAAGLGYPVGPVAIAGAMAVASAVHSDKGAMGQKGGYELPLTNMAAAVALALTGPGRYSLDSALGFRLSRRNSPSVSSWRRRPERVQHLHGSQAQARHTRFAARYRAGPRSGPGGIRVGSRPEFFTTPPSR